MCEGVGAISFENRSLSISAKPQWDNIERTGLDCLNETSDLKLCDRILGL